MTQGNPVYKTYPSSFEALDAVRRKLGDVAFGKEVAGYEGLTRQVAEDYYIKLSNIHSKYAGEAQDVLQRDYEIASRLIDKFKTKAGAKATAMDRIDATKFAADDKALPSTFFNSRQSVADAIELVGDAALVEREAANFVAKNLEGKNASAARTWITSKQNSAPARACSPDDAPSWYCQDAARLAAGFPAPRGRVRHSSRRPDALARGLLIEARNKDSGVEGEP